jgi:hypothetical protein
MSVQAQLRLVAVLSFLLCANSSALKARQGAAVVSGTVMDATGSTVSGAQIKLVRENSQTAMETLSDQDGNFSFSGVAGGPYHVTVSVTGFTTQIITCQVREGEQFQLPAITLSVAPLTTDVEVTLTRAEIAEEQIKEAEKQRVLGIIPNYYISYVHDAVPLSPKQKFELSWKFAADPVSFGITAIIAGVQQGENSFSGFGQGTEGYAKRYAASYANFITGTFISSAILPVVLKQDPRYFYKGTGTRRSRILYAIANAVVCKGDNGNWQPNYSAILGGLATGAISNLYYPAQNRNGVGLTFENALTGIASAAGSNIIEEFLSRKLTPHVHGNKAAKPPGN